MPNRYVREDAIESEAVNALSWQAEVFYRRLINRVDDFGRFSANPALLRALIFPLQLEKVRDADMARLIAECERSGLLFVYTVSDKQLLVLNKWEKGRATKSKFDPPPENICLRMQTFVYSRKHSPTFPPTPTPTPISDSDSFALSSASADRPSAKPRERNQLLDALAACDGSKPEQVTGSAWGAIAKALKEIKEVSPDVTPEEIARRARNYAKEFKDAAISPSALAKHWARCQSCASVRQMAPVATSMPEPTGWKAHLNKEHPDSPLAEGGEREARKWEDLDRSSQQWLTKEMAS